MKVTSYLKSSHRATVAHNAFEMQKRSAGRVWDTHLLQHNVFRKLTHVAGEAPCPGRETGTATFFLENVPYDDKNDVNTNLKI